MAALGARMLEKQKLSAEAAEAIRLRQSGEQSVLQSLANAISLGMTRAMQWFVDFMSASGDVSVELNTEFFEVSMNPSQLKELVAMWQGAGISKRTLFYNLQKGNVMRPDVTFEEEQQEIMKDGVL